MLDLHVRGPSRPWSPARPCLGEHCPHSVSCNLLPPGGGRGMRCPSRASPPTYESDTPTRTARSSPPRSAAPQPIPSARATASWLTLPLTASSSSGRCRCAGERLRRLQRLPRRQARVPAGLRRQGPPGALDGPGTPPYDSRRSGRQTNDDFAGAVSGRRPMTEPAASAPIKHPDRFFIDGSWAAPSSTAKIDVINSATEELFVSVAEAQAADVERAVAAARKAFDRGPWPRMRHAERAKYLRAIARELDAARRRSGADLDDGIRRDPRHREGRLARPGQHLRATTPASPTPSRSRRSASPGSPAATSD